MSEKKDLRTDVVETVDRRDLQNLRQQLANRSCLLWPENDWCERIQPCSAFGGKGQEIMIVREKYAFVLMRKIEQRRIVLTSSAQILHRYQVQATTAKTVDKRMNDMLIR